MERVDTTRETMALEQKLSLRMTQRLIMTPSLQQAIKMLQMTKLELQQEITQELTENPLLEEALESPEGSPESEKTEGEESSAATESAESSDSEPAAQEDADRDSFEEIDYQAYFQDYMDLSYSPRSRPEEIETRPLENVLAKPQSLYDHLLWQLDMNLGTARQKEIGHAVIGNIDDDGYLQATLEEIAAMGPYPMDEVEHTLHLVQEFDPPGIAARDLRECLLIQVAFHDMEGTPVESIVKDHLALVQARKFRDIAAALNYPVEEIVECVETIRHLDPKPGKKYKTGSNNYVVPDVYVIKIDKGYTILLNEDGLPRLRISSFYKRMIDRGNTEVSRETREYVREKFRSAFRIIKSLEERQRTIYKVARSIVKHQQNFLDYGYEHLRPLILRNVADDIGMHESTVSRVVNLKYMHTPRGLFEMKFFFHSSISTTHGEDISSLTVKERIKKIITEEDSKSPLSDAAIVSTLSSEGLRIARRTVAKYREELRIRSSNERRQGFR